MADPKITPATIASEGGHWYAPDHTQVALVKSADGKKDVEPTLRHARKLQLAPGVTTILRMAHKPQLEVWKVKQAIMASLTLPREIGETDDAYVDRILRDSKETARKAAEKGSALHAEVETGGALQAKLLAVLERTFGPNINWNHETCAVSRFGFGTKVDLWSSNGTGIILDIKTKDGDLSNVETYGEHAEQLAAGERALRQRHLVPHPPFGVHGIVFISRTHDVEPRVVLVPADQIASGWERFLCLLRYHQLVNAYRPSWADPIIVTRNEPMSSSETDT